jgi:hypothetical protein
MKGHPSRWVQSGMVCSEVARRASDYLEDRLPVFTKLHVDLHVASCAGCRSYIVQIGLVSSALRSLPKLCFSSMNLCRQFVAHHGQSAADH